MRGRHATLDFCTEECYALNLLQEAPVERYRDHCRNAMESIQRPLLIHGEVPRNREQVLRMIRAHPSYEKYKYRIEAEMRDTEFIERA